jgi:hypothetical protein
MKGTRTSRQIGKRFLAGLRPLKMEEAIRGGTEMATDDNKNVDGKSSANDPKAWQLWLVRADGSQIQLVAEGDARAELNRLHKRRLVWRTRSITTISPSASAISCDGEEAEEAGPAASGCEATCIGLNKRLMAWSLPSSSWSGF